MSTALAVNQEKHSAQWDRAPQYRLVVGHDSAAHLALHSPPRRSEVCRYSEDDELHSRHRILHQSLQGKRWDRRVHCCKDIGASAVLQKTRWASKDLLADASTNLLGQKNLQRLSHHLDDAIPEETQNYQRSRRCLLPTLPTNTACETSNLQARLVKPAIYKHGRHRKPVRKAASNTFESN